MWICGCSTFRPEDYEFHGFMVMRLIDVTEQEMLSSIKYDLLEKKRRDPEREFAIIQQKLRSLFRNTGDETRHCIP
jgi:hypothetical protein